MILIISDTTDQSTCRVIDWLKHFNCNYLVITDKDIIEVEKIHINGNFLIKIKDQCIYYNEISSVWYRRGRLNLNKIAVNDYELDFDIRSAFNNQIIRECNSITNFINYALLKKKSLNNFLLSSVNKLRVLYEAQKVGLLIPDTLITGKKAELLLFKNKYNKVVTKVASEGAYFSSKDYWFYAYTEVLTEEMINDLPEKFIPGLFQEEIQKKNEIRSFFIDGKIFSMAIFSQANSKTQIDYRHYDKLVPNRNIPFKLPEPLEEMIRHLMKILNLNCGSIDFIYGIDNNFYFLEVNPIGQFGMVSFPCNYQLEREIANYLKNNNHGSN